LPLSLPAELAQTLALVLHELATNAAKHGALAGTGGRLAVGWRLGPEALLTLDWVETRPSDGSTDAPSIERARRSQPSGGFGSTLLGRVVEAQLGGTIDHVLGPEGLRCRIAVPLARRPGGPAPRIGRDERPAPMRAADPATPRVLIAEDEALVALDLEASVDALGYHVFGIFPTVGEALASLEAGLPDVALIDANLRDESSAPLAERLTALGVPVVLATGYDSSHDITARFPKVAKLTKPVGPDELASTLAQVLARP
jgi:CheY-like chemotaxis protein